MKSPISLLLFVMIGSFATVALDGLFGISFEEVSPIAQIAHKLTYVAWGVILVRFGGLFREHP